jgi:hypothetical protein
MRVAIAHADELLRGAGLFRPESPEKRPGWWLPAIILFAGPIYGAMMGSFRLDGTERLWLLLFSGLKVPLLLLATSGLCLPAFFVLNTVLGLRNDFRDALQAILAGQAALSLALAALGPLTRFWYFSTSDYRAALLFNAAMFAVATIAGQLVMLRYYRVLIRRTRRHRLMLFGWLAMYVFVGIQMGWTLRPFVGDPHSPVAFFRQEPFTNAYVVVFHLLFGVG